MTPRAWPRLTIAYTGLQALGVSVLLGLCCVGIAAQELTPWTSGPTPPLTLTDQHGTNHTLAAYHGRVVLVNFWATWCAPCREEMPALQALAAHTGERAPGGAGGELRRITRESPAVRAPHAARFSPVTRQTHGSRQSLAGTGAPHQLCAWPGRRHTV